MKLCIPVNSIIKFICLENRGSSISRLSYEIDYISTKDSDIRKIITC